MIDAYLHDEVDYFYVAYDVVKPTDVDLFDSSSILSNRYFVSPFIRAQFSEVVWIRSKLGRGLVQSAAILCEYLTENDRKSKLRTLSSRRNNIHTGAITKHTKVLAHNISLGFTGLVVLEFRITLALRDFIFFESKATADCKSVSDSDTMYRMVQNKISAFIFAISVVFVDLF